MYRQYIPDLRLSIEQDTENVPNDGRYYVVSEGKVLGHFSSLKKAQELFKQVVQESGFKPKPPEKRKKSGAQLEVDGYLDAKDLYWADSHKFRGSGGRGGRGGV